MGPTSYQAAPPRIKLSGWVICHRHTPASSPFGTYGPQVGNEQVVVPAEPDQRRRFVVEELERMVQAGHGENAGGEGADHGRLCRTKERELGIALSATVGDELLHASEHVLRHSLHVAHVEDG